MKKNQDSNKKFLNKVCLICIFCISGFLLSGCETMEYTLKDFDTKNVRHISTDEGFVFSAYKKSSKEENIELTVGLSFTPVDGSIVTYIKLDNYNKKPYFFNVDDFKTTAYPGELDRISASKYLSDYQYNSSQNYQDFYNIASKTPLSLQATNPYGDYSKRTETSSTNSVRSLNDQISNTSKQITLKTVKSIREVAPYKSETMYIFYKDEKQYPIDIRFKDLEYRFAPKK